MWREKRMKRTHTEAFIDEVVECVTITCVCKLIVIGRQLLKTLDCNSTEVSRKCCVFRQHCCAPRYEAVDERLSPHVDPASSKLLNHSQLITSRVFSLTLPSPRHTTNKCLSNPTISNLACHEFHLTKWRDSPVSKISNPSNPHDYWQTLFRPLLPRKFSKLSSSWTQMSANARGI